jgi:hypothetical protein
MNKMYLELIFSIGALIYIIGCWFSLINAWRNGFTWQKILMILIGILYSLIYSVFSYTNKKLKPVAIILNYLGISMILFYGIIVRFFPSFVK